jgi:hypothetical protein
MAIGHSPYCLKVPSGLDLHGDRRRVSLWIEGLAANRVSSCVLFADLVLEWEAGANFDGFRLWARGNG